MIAMQNDIVQRIFHNYPIDLNLESVQNDPISHAQRDGVDYFIINSPDLIHHVLKSMDKYQKTGIFMDTLIEQLGMGVATSEGKDWARQRHALIPAFGKNKLDALLPKISRTIEFFLDNDLKKHMDNMGVAKMNDFSPILSSKVVIESLFSYSPSDHEVKELIEAGEISNKFSSRLAMMRQSNEQPLGHLALEGSKFKKIYDDFAYGLIARRKASDEKPDDILQNLLDSQIQNPDISELEIRNQIIAIFVGAYDTLSYNLMWSCFLLSQHPEIQQQLREEATSKINGCEASLETYQQLKFTQMVFKESLRLFPPIYLFHRTCVEEDSIAGITIPKGALVSISPWLLHRNKSFWNEPFRYDPNRFMDVEQVNPGFMPFGWGPHVCLGQGFAIRSAVSILAALSKRYRFELEPNQTIEAYGGFLLRPRFGIKIKFV